MKTPKLKQKNKAFTLIEMIVVVAVMAIIVAIAIPALSSSRNDAQESSAEARAKVLNEARDRAILKDIGGISSREQWDTNNWDVSKFTNGTPEEKQAAAAAAFLISNNLVRIQDIQ
jgi:prepilin-type N-terminal cleavage/methylation domain-containing protein